MIIRTTKKKIDFSKYTKNYQKKENTYNISDNIIEVNLLIDKEKNQKSYGINKILKTSLYYLKKIILLIIIIN